MRTSEGDFPKYRWADAVLWIKESTGDFVHCKNIDPKILYRIDRQLLMHSTGAQYQENLEEEVHVKLRPFIAKRLGYCRDECFHTEPVTRSSTGGWYARLLHGRSPAVFIVQEIKSKDSLWLTIIDESTGKVFESHPIQIHEGYALLPQPFRIPEFKYIDNPPSREAIIGSLLSRSTPDMPSLIRLIGDANIPHLRFGGFKPKKSARETLEQIVPKGWSQRAREETMAFLCYVLNDPAPLSPSVDSLPFSLGFMETPLLRNLIMLHQIHILHGKRDLPGYLALMWQYERLEAPNDGSNIAGYIYNEITKHTIYYNKHVQEYIIKMKKSKSIPVGLPVSKEMASTSRKARLQRLMYFVGGIYVLGRVSHRRVGLCNMIYIGKGYRWPHQHLEYALTLENTRNHRRPTMIQSVAVPPQAEETLLKERTQILPVSWYVHRTNPKLFSTQDADWRFNYEQVMDSLDPKYSIRSFERGYGIRKRVDPFYELNQDDIRVIDLVSSYLYLSDLESTRFVKSRGFDSAEQIAASIEKLAMNNVLSLIIDLIPGRIETLAIIASGDKGCILSLLRVFLQNTPRCTCYSLDSGKQYLALLSVSKYMGRTFQDLLPVWAEKNGVKLTCSFCSAAGNYRSNLFQRLRKEDGTWDSDITGLLAQVGK